MQRMKLLNQISMVEAGAVMDQVGAVLEVMEVGVVLEARGTVVAAGVMDQVMEAGVVSVVVVAALEDVADGDVAEADSMEEAVDSAAAVPLKHKPMEKLMKLILKQSDRYIKYVNHARRSM